MAEKLQGKQRRIYKPFTNCFPVMGKSARTSPMGGVHRISAGKAARAPTPGAPSASVGLTLRLAPGSPPRCGRARLPFALIIKGTKPSCELFFNQVKIPSLNKSTYGFCGHKYRPTLRVALTGASLPTAPRFLWRHFSRAKTPQDFSARENRMMTRKRTPAYWRMLLRGPRKVVRPRGERRSDEALEGCLFRRNSAPT